ncbi:MAG: DUF4274 domain-containing protein [Aureispira sp.]
MASKKLSPAEKLFKKARKHNWDNGYRQLYSILENKDCDKGTALMMYWLSSPQYFTQFATAEECESYNRDNYLFVKQVEKVFPTIKNEVIIYSPKADNMIGAEKENVKAPIPPIMYEDTPGTIPFEEINVYG